MDIFKAACRGDLSTLSPGLHNGAGILNHLDQKILNQGMTQWH
jgi:hypothetical protein